jgi:hypothetical protein
MRLIRRRTGQQTAELAPVLFILLFLGFFPLLCLLQVVVGYTGCWYLNCQQADLAAQSLIARGGQFTNTSAVQAKLDTFAQNWQQSPLGTLSKIQGLPKSTINGPTNSSVNKGYLTCYVTVSTQAQCSSFLQIPFLSSVPGLGAPLPVSISAQRVVEDATP